MLLEGKNAVVYGAGGSIGSAFASAFAAEGARVFLVGRTAAPLEAVAAQVTSAGGRADLAVLDALDEQAVEEHVRAVVAEAGSLDVSCNLASRGDVQGVPLVDLAVEDFLRPVAIGLRSTFLTARTAARQMASQGSGVVLALDSGSAQASPMMGGTGPADAAIDSLVRNLALEVGPSGVRVLGLWVAGIPETLSPEKLAAVNGAPPMDDAAFQGLLGHLDGMRITRRSPRLAEVAATATFLVSDQAAGLTATWVNATSMFPA